MTANIPVITIDGPGGAGKGTLCKAMAEALGWHLLDSGAIYRVLALAALHHHVDVESEEALVPLAAHLDVRFISTDGNLEVVLEGWLGEPTPLNLICAHRDQLSGPVRLLREVLQQRCAELLVAAPWRAPSGTRPVSRGAAGSGRSP